MDAFSPVDLSGLDLSGVTGPELLALLVEAVLASHGEQVSEAAFWSPDQPRVPAGQGGGGRWTSGQFSHVRDYHTNAVREIVSGKQAVAGDHAARLAHHLNHLTVEQLHGLKREHGLKGSGKNKAELVQKLAGRFAAARKVPAASTSATPAAAGDVGRFEAAARAVGGLDLKHNLLSLADLKQHYPGSMEDFHAEIQALRKAGVLTGQGIEGRGGITPEQQAALLHEGGSRIGYVSIRDPEHHRRLAAGGTPTPPAATPPPQAATHRALVEATAGGGFTEPRPRRFGGHFVEHQATGYQVHAHPGGDYSVRRAGSPDYVESRHATATQAVAAAAKGDRHQSTTGLGATLTAAHQQAVANAEARRQAPAPPAAPGRVMASAPAMPSAPRVTTPHAGTVAHVDALEQSLRAGLTAEHKATLKAGTNRQKRTLLARLAREHKAQGEGPLRAALFRVLGHANFAAPEPEATPVSTLSVEDRKKLPAEDFGDAERRLFPITDQDDVDSAARLIGKAKDPEAVKRRILAICKRKGLKAPAAWLAGKEAGMSAFAEVEFAAAPGGTADGDFVVRAADVICRAGDYDFAPDKGGPFSLSPEDILAQCADFSGSLELADTHGGGGQSIFDGKLGNVFELTPNADYTEFGGKARIPGWLDRLFPGEPLRLSATWDRATKRLKNVALLRNPRITDAALFAAFAADEEAKKGESGGNGPPPHGSPHGQKLMQYLHDMTAHSGARCSHEHSPAMMAQGDAPGNEAVLKKLAANFMAGHEADNVQKIHDLTLGSGAACKLYTLASLGKNKTWQPGRLYQTAVDAMPAYREYQPGNYALMSDDAAPPAPAGASAGPTDRERQLEAQFAEARQELEAERQKARVAEAGRIAAEAVAFAEQMLSPGDPGKADCVLEFRQAAEDQARHGGEVAFVDAEGAQSRGSRLDALRARYARRARQQAQFAAQPPGHGAPAYDPTREYLPGSEALFALGEPPPPRGPAEELAEARASAERYAERMNQLNGRIPQKRA